MCAHVHRCCVCTARTGAGRGESMQQWVDCGSLCLRMCQMYACMAVCWLFCAPICALRARSARAHLLCCGAPQCCFDGLRGRCTRLCCYWAPQCLVLWLAVACSARASGAIDMLCGSHADLSIIIFHQCLWLFVFDFIVGDHLVCEARRERAPLVLRREYRHRWMCVFHE